MKKILFGIALFSLLLAVVSSKAFAENKHNFGHEGNTHGSNTFNAESQLTKSQCGSRLGNPIIDVTQKVQNDADSGFGTPTYWAFDYYTRHIQVWTTGVNVYCAILTYNGNFYAVPGQGTPGNIPAGSLLNSSTDQPINGELVGGRRATIIGTLRATPLWPTNGSVGVTNYQCDLNDNCPGYDATFGSGNWANMYFTDGLTNVDQWWGWQYKAGSHGTWVNECANNAGDTVPGNNPACLGSSGNIL